MAERTRGRGSADDSRGGLDDGFARVLGRQPSARERERLHRLRDEIGIKTNDALWVVLIGLQYHVTLYEAIPARIEQAVERATSRARRAVLTTGAVCAVVLLVMTVVIVVVVVGHR